MLLFHKNEILKAVPVLISLLAWGFLIGRSAECVLIAFCYIPIVLL
jgi:hypothetical protein